MNKLNRYIEVAKSEIEKIKHCPKDSYKSYDTIVIGKRALIFHYIWYVGWTDVGIPFKIGNGKSKIKDLPYLVVDPKSEKIRKVRGL